MELLEVLAIWLGKQAGPELFELLSVSIEYTAPLAAVVRVYQLD